MCGAPRRLVRTDLELPATALRRACPPEDIPFETTAQAAGFEGVVGQERAVEALRFGMGIAHQGFNLFAVGPPGVGKQSVLRQLLGAQPLAAGALSDWCYVHDFAAPQRPRVLELPRGTGAPLQQGMARAVTELRLAMRAAFESEEYRSRKGQLLSRFKERQEKALTEIEQRARAHDVAVLRSESGLALAPLHAGEPLTPEKFGELPQDQKERLGAELERVGGELQALLRQFREWGREQHDALQALDRELASTVAHRGLEAVRKSCAELSAVQDYLNQVELDVVDSADEFLEEAPVDFEAAMRRALRPDGNGPGFRRYQVNLLVDNGAQQAVPVVSEDHPTYGNLVGRIEHESQFGALVTNFTFIKAGALHRANGGYLILDALRVLQQPWAWEGLKRTLRTGEIRIESLGQSLGLLSTVSIEPGPIPFRGAKVVLVGERVLYYLLASLDPDFSELFKVLVDFDDQMDRDPGHQRVYAQLVATLVKREQLRPFERAAVARVIDHAARAAGDGEKLSLHLRGTVDLLHEAEARAAGRELVTATDVQGAIDARRRRGGRVNERLLEAVRRGDVLISVAGERVGQVNALAVFQLGDQAFGHPTRITAQVRLGRGEVVDIEREVELGGPLHSKGVLILGGYLGARFATRFPLSLSATLVFEQSYGAIDGDSASLAELCALMTALAEVPVAQALALTGSINQHGEVQGIGGVNEKVEGFFDVCAQAGLTGEQGVLIPRSNVKNLMLREDVVKAVEAGQFHLYAVERVDEALELLTGRPAEQVNALAEARLRAFAEAIRSFQGKPGEKS